MVQRISIKRHDQVYRKALSLKMIQKQQVLIKSNKTPRKEACKIKMYIQRKRNKLKRSNNNSKRKMSNSNKIYNQNRHIFAKFTSTTSMSLSLVALIN